jgi:hypothetical protein
VHQADAEGLGVSDGVARFGRSNFHAVGVQESTWGDAEMARLGKFSRFERICICETWRGADARAPPRHVTSLTPSYEPEAAFR